MNSKLFYFLNSQYLKFTKTEFLNTDPVSLLHTYKNPEDIETAGFIVSIFSLGRVEKIISFSSELLNLLNPSPWNFLKNGTFLSGIRKKLRPYRFFSPGDIERILAGISKVIRENYLIKNLFEGIFKEHRRDLKKSTEEFMLIMRGACGSNSPGIKMAFPLPSSSACKRWNMFLRWMVRRDEIDFGIWDFMKPCELIIPLDTHIMKIARNLNLTSRSHPSWETAFEITERLKAFDPHDPVKYDFSLMRIGYFDARRKDGKKKQ